VFSSLMATPGRGQSAELALCLSSPRRLDLNQALASKCRVFVSQAAREGADPAKREPDEVPWSVASRCHRTCRPRCQRKEPFDRSLEDCARLQERGRDILQRRARRQATHHKMPECPGGRVVAGLFGCAQVGGIGEQRTGWSPRLWRRLSRRSPLRRFAQTWARLRRACRRTERGLPWKRRCNKRMRRRWLSWVQADRRRLMIA
jgi:hypothetical protein